MGFLGLALHYVREGSADEFTVIEVHLGEVLINSYEDLTELTVVDVLGDYF